MSALLAGGTRVVALGGGNDISYPDVAALADRGGRRVLAFNVDSHFDVREAPRATSGTPYRQLLDEGWLEPGDLYQMGHKPGTNSADYERYLARRRVPVYSFDDIDRRGVDEVFSSILHARQDADAVFWGFDMDAVRSSDAPGVSAGYPVGFTAAQMLRMATLAGRDPRTRVVEISECNPLHDIDGRTARLAAMMVVAYLDGATRRGNVDGPDPGKEAGPATVEPG